MTKRLLTIFGVVVSLAGALGFAGDLRDLVEQRSLLTVVILLAGVIGLLFTTQILSGIFRQLVLWVGIILGAFALFVIIVHVNGWRFLESVACPYRLPGCEWVRRTRIDVDFRGFRFSGIEDRDELTTWCQEVNRNRPLAHAALFEISRDSKYKKEAWITYHIESSSSIWKLFWSEVLPLPGPVPAHPGFPFPDNQLARQHIRVPAHSTGVTVRICGERAEGGTTDLSLARVITLQAIDVQYR